jgi:ABC-type amino acid transport system permease subunit
LTRLSSIPIVSGLARLYVSLIRGTPLLVQLFLIFYALPALGLTFNPFAAAIIAFRMTELLRVAQVAAAPTLPFFALYGVAAIYCWVILILSFGQQRLETG